MRIEEICEYLNELGILDIKHTSNFLSLYSGFIINNKRLNQNRNSEDNTFKLILFAYFKKLISSDKDLYEMCSNIISSHTKNRLIHQYHSICFLNKILFYQVKNKFNHFLFLLFKKKYPKRKYFPYNASYVVKSKSNDNKYQKSFNITNRRMKGNIYNDYSLTYMPMNSNNVKNDNSLNNIILNTAPGDKTFSQGDMDHNEFSLSNMNRSELSRTKKQHSAKKKKFIDITEKMNLKKKEISLNNMKKKLYDAQIRINNYESILPTSCKNRQKEIKEKEEEDYYSKLKEDKLYQKLTEKEIDKNNILDRLYRKEIIKIHDIKRKEKENKPRPKSPINWDLVNMENTRKKYLNINMNSHDINSLREMLNKPKNNIHSNKKGSFSFRNSINSEDNNMIENNFENHENINNDKMNNVNYFKNNNINNFNILNKGNINYEDYNNINPTASNINNYKEKVNNNYNKIVTLSKGNIKNNIDSNYTQNNNSNNIDNQNDVNNSDDDQNNNDYEENNNYENYGNYGNNKNRKIINNSQKDSDENINYSGKDKNNDNTYNYENNNENQNVENINEDNTNNKDNNEIDEENKNYENENTDEIHEENNFNEYGYEQNINNPPITENKISNSNIGEGNQSQKPQIFNNNSFGNIVQTNNENKNSSNDVSEPKVENKENDQTEQNIDKKEFEKKFK